MYTLIKYKRAQAIAWKIISSSKQTYWRQNDDKIGRETHLFKVWGMTRRMNGIWTNSEIPVQISNNISAINNTEEVELLATTC